MKRRAAKSLAAATPAVLSVSSRDPKIASTDGSAVGTALDRLRPAARKTSSSIRLRPATPMGTRTQPLPTVGTAGQEAQLAQSSDGGGDDEKA